MDEEPQDDGARLTELADFWLYEHLLSLPKSIATDEIVNHLGSKYPFRHGEGASLPAPISARLFLRHLREPPELPVTDWEEQLQLLGLMCQLSCKREQFRSRQAAAAMHPPSELMVEVLMQLLCTRADPAFSAEPDEQGELQQPLTSAAVASVAEELLSNADVEYLQDDEQLQNRLSLLEQLLRGRLEARKLQKHLREAFPAAAVEEHLREYADTAWAALGDTSLQRYQAEVLSGSLPFDPMQHFAVLAPVATQAAFEDVAVLDDAEASQQQRQQRTRASRPVPLLGEATAPALGAEELEPPGSSQGRRAGRGSRLQQAAAAAAGASPQPKASPMPRASPQQARSSPAAAVAAAGAEDAGKPGRRPRAPANKAAQEAAPAVHPTRKQLQLLPSNAAAAAAAGADRPEAEAGRKGRKSRRQQQEETEIIESEPPAATADMAAAAAGSGGRRRGRKASPAAAAAAPAGEAGSAEERQAMDGLDLLAAAGAAQEGGSGGKKGLGSAFQGFLNKPLDSLAAAAGGLAAVVRGSPASGGVSGGPKERKMCGAPMQGVRGRTVPWESPFGGSIDSPEEASPRGKSRKSAAAAAAGAPSRAAVDARKRKRAQQAAGGQLKGPLAAARAMGAARAPDSGNTEYQDAREEAGQSEESMELPAAAAAAGRQRGQGQGLGQSPRHKLHKQQQRQSPQRVRGGAAAAAAAAGGGDDSFVDDPESDDAFDYDGESDDEGSAGGQQQRRRQGRPSSKQQQRKRPAGGALGERARGGGAAFDPDFDEAVDLHGGHRKRRKVRRWTADEEALLIQLVAQEGEGQWALIHQLGSDGFDSRTQVDLKDKWRNLKKRGAVSD